MSVGNLTERIELRKKLKCQNFPWILDNVFTQSLMRTAYIQMGQISKKSGSFCFDASEGDYDDPLRVSECKRSLERRQKYVYFKTKQLAFGETKCVGIGNESRTRVYEVVFVECDAEKGNQKWELEQKVILYIA